MFVLRTGLQGNGKTLNTIKEVDNKAANEGRAVYYHNIRGFNPNSEVLKAVWEEFADPHKWYELPENSIIVIDEAQTFFRIRKPSAAVPEYASALETMRHKGHELHCITQNPGLIDHHFRKLCNAHIHYVRGHKGKVIKRWEFERVNPEVEKKNHFSEGESTRILLDKKYFGVYQSVAGDAEHHMRFKPPKALWLFLACVVIIGYLGWSLYKNRMAGDEPDEQALPVLPMGAISDEVMQAIGSPPQKDNQPLSLEEYIALRTPRLPDVPSSAPLYDAVTTPVTYPRLSCIYTDSAELLGNNRRFMQGTWDSKPHGCFCNTQQGTRAHISFEGCMNYAMNGAFDPAKPEPQAVVQKKDKDDVLAGGAPKGGMGRASRRNPSPSSLPSGSFGMLTGKPIIP